MKQFLFFLFTLFFITSAYTYAKEKQTSKIPKDQFCHFAYSIYKGCYQRGLVAGVKCGALAEGIKFGKAFLPSQKEYIKQICKTACFLGKNKFKMKTEGQFVSECIAKH